MTIDELKREIVDAFEDMPVPSEIAAYESWESQEAEKTFKGRRWTDITAEEANYYPLFLLGPEAWRHYLAAYLLAALDDYKDILNRTIHALRTKLDMSNVTSDLEKQRYLQEVQDRCLNALDEQQRKAVHEFLRFVARDPALLQSAGDEVIKVLAEWDQLLLNTRRS